MQASPNILFVTADQWGARDLACYGNALVQTPNLDALAQRGRRYERCYATCPMCAPNRATWLTGRSPVVHGVVTNNYCLQSDPPTFPRLLQRAGYYTGIVGKLHQTPMQWPHPFSFSYLGFDEAVISEDPKWGPWLRWVEATSPEHFDDALAMCWDFGVAQPQDAEERSRYLRLRKAFRQHRETESSWPTMGASSLPEHCHDSHFISEKSIEFLERSAKARNGQPFFLHVSYVDPHDPYDPPEPWASRWKFRVVPEPIPAGWENDSIAELRLAQAFNGFDRIAHDPEAIRQLRRLYYASVEFLDDEIGRLLQGLESLGLSENTIVVFSTDHGEMLGDHALITKGLSHYDRGIRVPLIVAGPGIQTGVDKRLACTLDFFPSFCDWARIAEEERPPLEGYSFAQAHAGGHTALSVAYGLVRSVITEDAWRYTQYLDSGRQQLFCLADDVEERVDLAADPKQAGRLRALQRMQMHLETRPGRIPQYRNMPVSEGRRWWVSKADFGMRMGPSDMI